MTDLLKLNLGCGKHPLSGYVNVDKYGEPDLRWDLECFPWPWENDSVGAITMNHVLEHLGATSDIFLKIIKELYRVCADGALIRIVVPHPRHDCFLADPTHVRPITPLGLSLFSKKRNEMTLAQGHPDSPLALYHGVDFEIISTELGLDEPWASQAKAGTISDEELQRVARIYNNVVGEIRMVMKVIKPSVPAA